MPWRAEWIAPEWHHWYRGGAALPIRSAELELRAETTAKTGRPLPLLRGSRRRQPLSPGATEEAIFHLRLPLGDYRLSARFWGREVPAPAFMAKAACASARITCAWNGWGSETTTRAVAARVVLSVIWRSRRRITNPQDYPPSSSQTRLSGVARSTVHQPPVKFFTVLRLAV